MLAPGYLPLTAQRWQDYSDTIDFIGQDFTGATFSSEIRAYKDAPGAPIATLNVSLVSVTTDALGIKTSRVLLAMPETGVDPLNFTNPRGGDLILVYDLHVTSSIGKRRQVEGSFIVRAGVTQNG